MPELAKAYDPSQVEDRLYQQWCDSGLFTPDTDSERPAFSIVIPPPNVTGMLTMGHVLNNTLQDILCRKARLDGKEVLWLPGTDHAGIATQTVVEKKIRKEQRQTRHDVGRDAFLEKVWEWKEKHGGIIIRQLRKLGCSCDWTRERFTMDEDYSKAVAAIFVELYNRGYIYRGKRLVNWCPASLTAISDEEVIPTPQKGKLYYMKYEVAGEPGRFLEIATTRPETLMGDTAVAVHPEDERYRDLIGRHAVRPFPKAEIPIVADSYIDKEFGTGVLKVTPAHDKADFEIGQRHNLPVIDVLTPDGKINCPEVPELHGLDRFEARKKSAEMLGEMGQLIREEDYQNSVGFSERGKVPIEPRLSEQWFLRYPKVQESLDVVRNGLIRFFPDRWAKVYQHWLDNIQDWCISRQLWWGHRIPVWYKDGETRCQIESPGEGWEQDPDVLDTWFSSWLWAYETMDEKTRARFYPTSVLVTGPDIIFLWVARMIIAGLEFLPGKDDSIEQNIAFRDVYFTGLIRDSKGRKMSKSLGNSPDPLELIARYGADGLRFGLMRIAPQGQDIRFDEKQIEEGRNFCNKIWNSCRFRLMQGEINPAANPHSHADLTPFCHLVLRQLDELITRVDKCYEGYEFSNMAGAIYAFVWGDFCSRFLETAKADFSDTESTTRQGTLDTFDYVLSRILRLLHPYAPFITEELWLDLGFGDCTIQRAEWPRVSDSQPDETLAARAAQIYETVEAARRLRGEFSLPANQKLRMLILSSGNDLPGSERLAIEKLVNLETLETVSEKPARTPMTVTPLGEVFLPLEGVIDPEQEKARLEKEIAKYTTAFERENNKLQNETMCSKAPADKVAEWRAIAEEASSRLSKLRQQLEDLSG